MLRIPLLECNFVCTPLQRKLRMVCQNLLPRRLCVALPVSPLPDRPATCPLLWGGSWRRSVPLGARRIGLANTLVMLPVLAAAEGWQSTEAQAAWSGSDRFVAASARAAAAPKQGARSRDLIAMLAQMRGSELERLMALIAFAEAPRDGYDSVQHGAKIKPPKRPTEMTLGEIAAWIRATPGQHHAIGRYQIIPTTLAHLVRVLELSHDARFDATTQDAMARVLIAEAGFEAYRTGAVPRAEFMDALARVWAGLPLANGRSAYHGIAGNKATITRRQYAAAMALIFPLERAVQ